MHETKIKKIILSQLFIIAMLCAVNADVRVEFPGTFIGPGNIIGPEPYVYNTTNIQIDLAGWRFKTPNYVWSNLEGDIGATVTVVSNAEIETRLSSQLSRTIPYTGETPLTLAQHGLRYAAANLASGDDGTPSSTYILWKTRFTGIDDPVDEDPIKVNQIDSIISEPDYYNSDYRYKDSLGVNGWIDTYYGKTQIMLPIPQDIFTVNVTGINLAPSETGGPLYWMALAMGQEYFHMDKQFMIAIGLKESGIAADGLPYSNSPGVYGPFHIENLTCIARAIAFPKFCPDYFTELASSANTIEFTTQVMPANDFCDIYFGGYAVPEDSAHIVNSVIISGLGFYYLYDLLAYAQDICWKEVLEFCIDHYVGIAALTPLYNIGMNSGAEAPLHVNNYETLLNDPNASNQFPVGTGNYRIDIINAVNALVNASEQSLTDSSIVLWDSYITIDDIQRFFFGDGGSVSSQGDGGILKHFTVDRENLWTDLQAAFNKLSPHWSQDPPAISYRYDFLTLLRVAKGYFDVSRPKPLDYESTYWIEARSTVGGCSDTPPPDEEFPYMDTLYTLDNGYFSTEVRVKDNKNIENVKWTIDYNWGYWKEGAYDSGSVNEQYHTIFVPEADIQNEFGDSIGYVYISVSDSSGNTIVKKVIIPNGNTKIITENQNIINNTFFLKPYSCLSGSSIKFNIGLPQNNVNLKVVLYNMKGERIALLHNGTVNSRDGIKSIYLNKRNYADGIYFVSVKASDFEKVVKLKILK